MCRYGDIFITDLGSDDGNIQSGVRPVIVVSNDLGNKFSGVATVVPMSSQIKKKELPTHVIIQDCGLERPSMVLAEQITSLNQSSLLRKIGSIRKTVYESKVKKAIEIQLNLVRESI